MGVEEPAYLFRQNEHATLDKISQSTEECKTMASLHSRKE